MTEAEWCHEEEAYFPREMLRALDEQFPPRQMKTTKTKRERKLRLFGCAACRQIAHLFVKQQQRLIALVEQYADGKVDGRRIRRAQEAASRAVPQPKPDEEWSSIYGAYDYAQRALNLLTWRTVSDIVEGFVEDLYGATVNDPDNQEEEGVYQKALLQDIFGNPFRPVSFSPSWRTGTALSLAKQMYEAREFSAMPILADALQDAGCDNDDILSHCRGPGPHVRGCWVVDLVLGKA
jgi:hypothetical protein